MILKIYTLYLIITSAAISLQPSYVSDISDSSYEQVLIDSDIQNETHKEVDLAIVWLSLEEIDNILIQCHIINRLSLTNNQVVTSPPPECLG